MNWAEPSQLILGRLGVASTLNSGPLHCLHATGTVKKKMQKKKEVAGRGKKADMWWRRGGDAVDCGIGRAQLVVVASKR